MRHRFTPATVLALIALFVALTSSATAASYAYITGAQIKNGSVGLADLSKKAKKALKGQRGPRGFTGTAGPAGPAGLAGAVGPQGPAGANGANGGFDPDKVSYTAGAFVSIPPGSADTSVAPCPAGSKVVGGGFYSDAWLNGGLYVTDQGPLDDGSGWYMDFYNSASASTDAFVQAYAVCAAA
jgi:hypothetical protein